MDLRDQEGDLTLNINIKHKKDSLVRVSVAAPFGIELFRTTITKDSIYFINHTNKTFFIKPNIYISTFLKTDISFEDIQEMITANPRVLKKKYKLHFGKNTFELKNKQAFYIISADFYRVLSSSIVDGEREFFYEFGLYTKQNDFVFPKTFLIRFNSPSESFEAKLSYSRVVFNQQQNVSFKIPGSYVEVE